MKKLTKKMEEALYTGRLKHSQSGLWKRGLVDCRGKVTKRGAAVQELVRAMLYAEEHWEPLCAKRARRCIDGLIHTLPMGWEVTWVVQMDVDWIHEIILDLEPPVEGQSYRVCIAPKPGNDGTDVHISNTYSVSATSKRKFCMALALVGVPGVRDHINRGTV